MIEQFAPAKVNLTLHVTGRRGDGYHLLDSLVVFGTAGDRITVEPCDDLQLSLTGPLSDGVPADDGNLVIKAAKLFQIQRGITTGARIVLDKHLPHGAGIGGGSSDAAATVLALSRLWQATPLSRDEALILGADVPVCLQAPNATIMSGIGEKVTPAPMLPEFGLLLVNPNEHIATPAVFKSFANQGSQFSKMTFLPSGLNYNEFVQWLMRQRNALTPAASAICPKIKTLLRDIWMLDGCDIADMSGSGSTCWGIFRNQDMMDQAALALKTFHADYWISPNWIQPTVSD